MIQRLNIPLKKDKVSICSGEMPIALVTGMLQYINLVDMYRMNEEGYVVLCKLLKFSRTKAHALNYIKAQGKKVKKMLDNWEHLHSNFWDKNWKEFYLNSMDIVRNFVDKSQGYVAYFERIKILVEIERTIERLNELRESGITFEVRKFESNIVVFADTFSVKDYLEHKFKALGYIVNKTILNAADFGVPQTRERFIMIGIKEEILRKATVQLPTPIVAPENYFTVQEAIKDLEQLEPSIQMDTIAMHAVSKGNSKLASLLCDNSLIWNHIATDTGKIAKERFKALEQGENFHNLDVGLKKTYSLPERTQKTIYLRLKYGQPSGTVMNVRKSMWIHPTLDRALSIREAARLQSFPNSFVFYGTKNAQYQQVGNAVPPLLGQAIAECLLEQLGIQSKSSLTKDLRIKVDDVMMA
jgi:DNA (cytosine-5)-methyltransferase 1